MQNGAIVWSKAEEMFLGARAALQGAAEISGENPRHTCGVIAFRFRTSQPHAPDRRPAFSLAVQWSGCGADCRPYASLTQRPPGPESIALDHGRDADCDRATKRAIQLRASPVQSTVARAFDERSDTTTDAS